MTLPDSPVEIGKWLVSIVVGLGVGIRWWYSMRRVGREDGDDKAMSESLRWMLQTLRDEVKTLRDDNATLRARVAHLEHAARDGGLPV